MEALAVRFAACSQQRLRFSFWSSYCQSYGAARGETDGLQHLSWFSRCACLLWPSSGFFLGFYDNDPVKRGHWSECGRAASLGNVDALGRPHRSVLSLMHPMRFLIVIAILMLARTGWLQARPY